MLSTDKVLAASASTTNLINVISVVCPVEIVILSSENSYLFMQKIVIDV